MAPVLRMLAVAAAVRLSGVAFAGAGSAPSNVSPPAISGQPAVGGMLSVSTGTWTGTPPLTFAFQWLRCERNGARCTPIGGATGTTYTVQPADAGGTLRAGVTARNRFGSTSVTTAQFAIGAPSTTTTTTTTLPAQATEVCGNCLDDDGDGLVDDADPACCPASVVLRVRRARFRAGRLRFRARIEDTFAAADPTAEPVRVQIGGSAGTVLCTALGPWTRRRGGFRFRGSTAGLHRGVLRTRGKGTGLSLAGRDVDVGALSGPELRVTLRVGALCAAGRAPLRRKGGRLIAP